jgi:hypothetical protein
MTPEQEKLLREVVQVTPVLAGSSLIEDQAFATCLLAAVMLVTSEFWQRAGGVEIFTGSFQISESEEPGRWVVKPTDRGGER